jgi:GntR family transcriptional regulator, galactonate operon transcriptional repressor
MKNRTHDIILDEIGIYIVKGHVKPGEYLPGDADLCKRYGIGRSTLREIFKVLKSKGLLLASPKKGTWVNEKENWDFFDPQIFNWAIGTPLEREILADVVEARCLIEPSAARLAARNSNINNIAQMEDAYNRMAKAKSGSNESRNADVDFHVNLFKASHNKLWVKFGQILSVSLVELFKFIVIEDHFIDTLPQHKKVIDAIRMKQEDVAEEIMKELTQYSRKVFLASSEKSKDTKFI